VLDSFIGFQFTASSSTHTKYARPAAPDTDTHTAIAHRHKNIFWGQFLTLFARSRRSEHVNAHFSSLIRRRLRVVAVNVAPHLKANHQKQSSFPATLCHPSAAEKRAPILPTHGAWRAPILPTVWSIFRDRRSLHDVVTRQSSGRLLCGGCGARAGGAVASRQKERGRPD